jgi:hypothetical protein
MRTNDNEAPAATRAHDEDEEEAPRPAKRRKRGVAFTGETSEVRVDAIDAPLREKQAPKKWHVALGPYLWASSVDANISLGSASVSSGVDFMDIRRNAKYGVPVVAEVRYGRFAFYGDLLYGVVGIDGAKEVGPLMVTLTGSASSLMVDGAAGYTFAGSQDSLFAVEARAGVRYQRTAIVGSVDVSGADVSPPKQVNAAADALAGARVMFRPLRRLSLAGTFDIGVAGMSTSTWSGSTDACLRIGNHVLLSLGYRMLTTERTNVSIVMHGPRLAAQLKF